MHKSRPGITPCGFIRDCWFPSSITLVIITGEERKGSGTAQEGFPVDRRQAHGSPALLDLGVDHRQATNQIADRPCDLVHIPRRTNRLTGPRPPRPEAEILEVANDCYRKSSFPRVWNGG